MRAVHVLFYSPDEGDRWLNHVVTAFDPPYSHCDIQFDDGFASSVYQGEAVYWQQKSFARTNYTRVSLCLSEDEYQRVRAFCQHAHLRGHRFDLLGMVCSKLPVAVRKPAERTFCSRFVLEALQVSGRPEFLKADPCLVTPSGLHALLVECNKSFLDVSEKRLRNLTTHNVHCL